jgi:phage terminase large subunit-like protein
VVETGTGKRDNSLLWVITTAGSNRSGICYEIRTFVTRLLDRRVRGRQPVRRGLWAR